MSRALLITGATGRQGGAVVQSLLQAKAAFILLAVTRSPTSPNAQRLKQLSPQVLLVQGDLDDPKALFESAQQVAPGSIWGVYSVQTPIGSGQSIAKEIQQGKALVDEALRNGVKHFVYSSVDRGGDKSFVNPTSVPHFASKHAIEHYLVDKTAGKEMTWTILRPVGFMDNYTPGFQAKVFLTAWKVAIDERRSLQLVAVADIGHFAAQAFTFPEKYRNRALSLAGDALTFEEAQRIFRQSTSRDMPTTFGFVASLILYRAEDLSLMFKWLNDEGYAADIEEVRKEHSGLMDFGTYLKKHSGFVQK